MVRPPGRLRAASRTWNWTTRWASVYGNGSSNTFWMTLKIVVAEPIPRARATTARAANAGCRRRPRSPYRRSWRNELMGPPRFAPRVTARGFSYTKTHAEADSFLTIVLFRHART